MTSLSLAPPAQAVDPSIFDDLLDATSAEFINSNELLRLIVLCLVSESNLLMLGVPGVAKTKLVVRLLARISNAIMGRTTMTKTTSEDRLLGPISIDGLKGTPSRLYRDTKGYLPEANVGYIDEAGKATKGALDALCEILLEHTFRDDGQTKKIPLTTAILTSNELLRTMGDMAAIEDRLELWYVVEELSDPEDLRAMMRLPDYDENPPTVLDWSDVQAATAASRLLPVTVDAEDAMLDIIVKLRDEGIRPSPRRIKKAMRIAQCEAWLEGATQVLPEHLDVLCHMMWKDPKDRAKVSKIVLPLTSPFRALVAVESDTVAGLTSKLAEAASKPTEDPDRLKLAGEVLSKLKRSAKKLVALEQGVTGKDAAAVADAGRRIDKLADETQLLYGFPNSNRMMTLAREGKLEF